MSPVVGYIFGFRVCVPCSVVSLVSGLSPVVSVVSGCQFVSGVRVCGRLLGLRTVFGCVFDFVLHLRLRVCLCMVCACVSGSGLSPVVGSVCSVRVRLLLSVLYTLFSCVFDFLLCLRLSGLSLVRGFCRIWCSFVTLASGLSRIVGLSPVVGVIFSVGVCLRFSLVPSIFGCAPVVGFVSGWRVLLKS